MAPGAGTPRGKVAFLDGSTTLATVSLSDGSASYTIDTLVRGSHTISAPVILNNDLAVTVAASTSVLTMSGTVTATGRTITKDGAGKLESRNVKEYETAARYARDCRYFELIDCLLEMAEVEWDHELYFRSRVLSHRLGRRLSLWPQPPAKETIRLSYEGESGTLLEDKSRNLRERATTAA